MLSLFTMMPSRQVQSLQVLALKAFIDHEPAVLTSLGLVWKRDVPNVRRERVERRRELARLWEGGSTGVDIFDLRYLFGKEIDPDCW
ncbi:uncharacterized protein LOC114881224 isoform X2 [Osmia bicornis bicornis]|uniref:uncharacterized protein LOC114881224 isoform X2 n=1 Tax=Osmia bicornis bicornis TaxID=1437191 RepID=UPI0010F5AC55|nr:uncharacterized protein LOC114881224 isoform X2 [Osmia bicornis bicornis]